ncbi:MAG: DUF6049 family protein [Actinomycetota bacterium]|nr:DUF6049 family protein [Actinomycetota bacterium]
MTALVLLVAALLAGWTVAIPDRSVGTAVTDREVGREPVSSGLDVTMESLSPSQLQPGSPVQVTGTITDVEGKKWTNLKVYLVLDQVPVATPEALDTVLASEPDQVSGERIVRPGTFLELGDLEAGASLPYSLEVPFGALGLDAAPAGVYTVGIHVLADVDRVTAGRARTLVPLVPPSTQTPPVDLTVLLPLRTPLVREPDGTYADLDGVLEQVAPGGRMHNLLGLAATAQSGQAAVLLDPALVDLLIAVVDDDFSPLEGPEKTGAEADPDLQTPVNGVVSSAQRGNAAQFLADLRTVTSTVDLLVEPYGAADITAVRELGSRSLKRSITRMGALALQRAGLDAEPVLLPVGDLAPDLLAQLARRRSLVLGSEQVRAWNVTEGAGTWLRVGNATTRRGAAPVVVVDETLTEGGPEPGITDSLLQIRQRLLSETAVLAFVAAASDDQPAAPGLVYLADAEWDPGVGLAGSDLFDGLDTSWISSASLAAQLPGAEEEGRARPANVDAPGSQDAANVSLPVVQAARGIRRQATLVQSLVGSESRLLRWYDRAAALTVSSHQRADPAAAVERADTVSAQLDRLLGEVAVEGPEFVTLSSNSGSFPITVTNNLPRPITVGLSLNDSANALQFDPVPLETIDAGDSAQLTLEVGAPDLGVTAVSATLMAPNGRTFGTPAAFNLRGSVVGAVIWVAFGAGGLFLVLLVVRRLGRRVVTFRRGRVAS